MSKQSVRGNPNRYGIPYQGSKTKLIGKIHKLFPPAENFYDIFGGGFSVTHFMLENRKNDFKHFYFNEIRPGICELVKDAIGGKYNYKVFKPEFIKRDKFFAEKETNPYIKIVWSFGNNGKDYLFGEDIESQKRSMHQAVVFGEFDEFMVNTFKINKWPENTSTFGRRILLKSIIRRDGNRCDLQQLQQLQQLEQLERLQQLERVQQLEQLQQLERVYFTSLDYRQIKINDNSVVYCDPPYIGTADYERSFNHKEFYNWCDAQKNPVFISEYRLDDSRFKKLKIIDHASSFSGGLGNKTQELVFGNKVAFEMLMDLKLQSKGMA